MKTLEKMMVYLSGTDIDVYEHVGEHKGRNRIMYALFNIFIGIFVFVGTYHLVTMMFQTHDINGNASMSAGFFILAILVSIFFSMLVTLFNVSVLSSHTKIRAILRIPMSLIFSLVFSIPILLNFFDGKITKELRLANEKKVENIKFDVYSDVKKDLKKSIKDIETYLPKLDKKINFYNRNADIAQEKANKEIEGRGFRNKIATCGRNCKAFLKQSKDASKKAEKLNQEKAQKYADLKEYKQKLNTLIREEKIDKERKENEIKSIETYDIITKASVLFDLIKKDEFIFFASVLAFLFLIVIDLFPTFSKLTQEKDDYDKALKTKAKLNDVKQKAVLNKLLKEIENGDFRPEMMTEIYDVLEK